MSKSYVSVEQAVCPVCGTTFDTGNLLMDTRMRDRFERNTITHKELCPEHKRLHEEGCVALVEVSNAPSSGKAMADSEARRTGAVAHVRRTAWPNIFDSEAPAIPLVFVEVGVIDKLKGLMPDA